MNSNDIPSMVISCDIKTWPDCSGAGGSPADSSANRFKTSNGY